MSDRYCPASAGGVGSRVRVTATIVDAGSTMRIEEGQPDPTPTGPTHHPTFRGASGTHV